MKGIQYIAVIDLTEKSVSKTIEIIDDFNISARFFKVHTTISLEKLLEKESLDLIILELQLESYQGYKTFKAVQEVADDVPILVYSSVNNEVIITQVLRAGALDYLVKSETNGKQLARAIRNAPIKHQAHLALASAKIDLRKAEKRSKEAQEIARFGDWTLDIVTGEVTWSDTMYEIFNFPIGTNINDRTKFLELVYPEDYQLVNDFINETIKKGSLQEITFRTQDNRGFQHLKMRAKVQMYDPIGSMVVVGTCQDITKEIQSQSAIIAQHLSGRSKKLQREMLGHLGFNIRTYMGSLVNLFYLFEETVVKKDQKALLGGMKTSFDELHDELHQFLNSTVALADELKIIPQQIHLRNFLNSLLNFVKTTDRNEIDITTSERSNLPDFLLFDGDKLQQVLLNVVRSFNRVSTTTSRPIQIQLDGKKQKSNHLWLSVQISVKGYYPYAQDEMIFSNPQGFLAQAATQQEEIEEGDIDLAVATRLINILNGKMSFSTNAKITKLQFSIPVIEINERLKTNASKPLYALHILLVEDHIINQIATKKVLEKWGNVSVDIAKNGKVAIEKLAKASYDLVLMDLQMPILGGIAATEIIRQSSHIPIIALTAHASDEEKENCLNIGMNDYLTKPFKPKELYLKINQTIERISEKGA